jgi:TatD DNase family protein
MIDAHIHLYQYVSEHLHHQIERWKGAGIRAVIAVANDLPSSYRTLELKDQFPDFVHAAVGFHPEQPLPPEKDFVEWEKLISAAVAVNLNQSFLALSGYSINSQRSDRKSLFSLLH